MKEKSHGKEKRVEDIVVFHLNNRLPIRVVC